MYSVFHCFRQLRVLLLRKVLWSPVFLLLLQFAHIHCQALPGQALPGAALMNTIEF